MKEYSEKIPHLGLRRLASLVGVGYLALVAWLAFESLNNTIVVTNAPLFLILFSAVSILCLAAMVFSRLQVLTKIVVVLLLLAAFPLLLLCFGQWSLVLPVIVTALLAFFLSGIRETPKTVFGVIFLLIYVLGSLAYFMVDSLFTTKNESVLIAEETSPSGHFHYQVLRTEDNSGGDLTINVTSNEHDINLPFLTLKPDMYTRAVYMKRPIPDNISTPTWSTLTRQEITASFLAISEDVTLDLSAEQMTQLGIPLTYDDNDLLEEVPLKNLTDADLAAIGIPEVCDVLTYEGEICFRAYTEKLDNFYTRNSNILSSLVSY